MTRSAVSIAVRNVEKRYQPTRCYKFVLEVTWSDKSKYVIYRSYSEFLEMHMELLDAFPVEAGEINPEQRILPKLSGVSLFSRSEVQKVAEKRRTEISDYCNRLMALHDKITQFPKLLEFLKPKEEDLNVPSDSKAKKSLTLSSIGKKLKKKKKKSRGTTEPEFEITNPLQLQTYVAVASYKAVGKAQISFQEGDILDVIDKNPNGWWYVSCSGLEGWVPATYLDKTGGDETETDEIPCLAGEKYLTIKDYTATYDDELSFGSFVVVEVLNRVLNGWWIASYDGKVGYVPSTYLQAYTNPYLESKRGTSLPTDLAGSPLLPTPRRQSIKNIPAQSRDLQPYRRATEKRRQRTIKQKKPSDDDLSDLPLSLSLIIEADDDADYLTPSQISTSSTPNDEESYVDSDRFPPPRDSQSNRSSRLTTSSSSSSLTQVVAPPTRKASKVSDTDEYEPVNTHDYQNDPFAKSDAVSGAPALPKRTAGKDLPPQYLAPPAPPRPQPPPADRKQKLSDSQPQLLQKVRVGKAPPSIADEYEVVSDTTTSRAPPPPAPVPAARRTSPPTQSRVKSPVSPPPINQRPGVTTKVPPPRPSHHQFTGRSNVESDSYEYIDNAVKPPPKVSNSPAKTPSPVKSPVPLLPTPRKLQMPSTAKGPPLLKPNKPAFPSQPVKPERIPRSVSPAPPSLVPTPVSQSEQNNNANEESDGKIYEEFLIKPSQLKGKNNANVRAPKGQH